MQQLNRFANDSPAPSWWKFPLLWLVISGPVLVVIASFITFWLAVRQPDPVVAPDYYRRGIDINRELGSKGLLPAQAGRNHAATPPLDLPAPSMKATDR